MSYFYSFLSKGIDFFLQMLYTKAMKSIYHRPVCSVTLGSMRLRILRTGKSVRLRPKAQPVTAPQTVRGVHSHFTYEIFFVTDGSLELVTEGGVTVYEGAAVIIPPRLKHYTLPKGDGCFCLLFVAEQGGDPLPDGICALPLSADSRFYITKMAEKAECEGEQAEQECAWLTSLLFSELMGSLHTARGTAAAKPIISKHVNEIEQYINANLYKKITLGDVAGAVFLSQRQISRIVAAEYGCSLSQLVTAKKLDAAQMLLCNTDMSVSAVAAEVGVGAENYFFRLFKKRFGVSPLQYRMQAKKQP